jgi:glyoxylase-like metal-dependent hydrolase (beta-lactamase superfamily II)
MLPRKYVFPHVIEMNIQAGERLGVNVYLVDGGSEWLLIDVGFKDTVDEILDLIRKLDFRFAACKMIIATHADADHIQGLARAREALKTKVAAHPASVEAIETGDGILTYATIKAQNIDMPMFPCKVDQHLNEGDTLTVGDVNLQVWHTPGHTPGHLSFKLNGLLFCGDAIYKDSSVGVIDAHHGSNIKHFLTTLERIKADDSAYLLPSHGPIFRRDNRILQQAIDRLKTYLHLSDFGTCAEDSPIFEDWDAAIEAGGLT